MLNSQPLDLIPLWVLYLLTVFVLLAAAEFGYLLARAAKKKVQSKGDSGVGSIAGATLAMLAFMMAFVVSFAVGIFHERRQLVIKEANAIGTSYLRAGFLNEPYKTEARDLLREYVDLRLEALDRAKLANAKARSEEIHLLLWQSAEEIAVELPNPITSLYINSLNEVIDVHTERVSVGLGIRVPPTILHGVYLMAVISMFLVGMQNGYLEQRNILALILLVLILSIAFLLIVDLDRSQEGFLRVPQNALLELQSQLAP